MDAMELFSKNLHQLDAIAEADEIYQVWYQSHQDLWRDFKEYIDKQPLEIYHMLQAYVESGELMSQRKIELACELMEFKNSKE